MISGSMPRRSSPSARSHRPKPERPAPSLMASDGPVAIVFQLLTPGDVAEVADPVLVGGLALAGLGVAAGDAVDELLAGVDLVGHAKARVAGVDHRLDRQHQV